MSPLSIIYEEIVQVTDRRGRRVKLTRGFQGTKAAGHEAGPWMIVSSPRSGELGPNHPIDIYRVALELPDFSARVRWITVHSDVVTWLGIGYLLVPLLRVGDPNPDGRWDRA